MDDCAEQLVRLALKPQTSHFAYNNGGHSVIARGVAEMVRHWLPAAQIEFDATKPLTPLIDAMDGSRLEREIDFKPRPRDNDQETVRCQKARRLPQNSEASHRIRQHI